MARSRLVDNGEITTPQYFECRFTNYDGEGRYIVFKNLAASKRDPYSTNYLDDVKLDYVDEESCVKPIAYEEDFEGYTLSTGTMGVEPDCWEVITPESELSPSTCPHLSCTTIRPSPTVVIIRCVCATAACMRCRSLSCRRVRASVI